MFSNRLSAWLSKLDSWISLNFRYPNMDRLHRALAIRHPRGPAKPSRARGASFPRATTSSRANSTTPHASSVSSATALAPVPQPSTHLQLPPPYPCLRDHVVRHLCAGTATWPPGHLLRRPSSPAVPWLKEARTLLVARAMWI